MTATACRSLIVYRLLGEIYSCNAPYFDQFHLPADFNLSMSPFDWDLLLNLLPNHRFIIHLFQSSFAFSWKKIRKEKGKISCTLLDSAIFVWLSQQKSPNSPQEQEHTTLFLSPRSAWRRRENLNPAQGACG
jgi:hypothetical protein